MYLSQWRFNRIKTESGNISNPYNIHKALWKAFPNMEDAKRDFVYRVDKTEHGWFVLLLSGTMPKATQDMKLLRGAEFNPNFTAGAEYLFSLRANPVKRLSEQRCRVPLVKEEDLNAWLVRKFALAATVVEASSFTKSSLNFCKGDKWGKIVSVDFQGTIRCENPDDLLALVKSGIGSGKAFGCGLLLLKRK